MVAEFDNPVHAYLPVPEIVARLGLYVTGAGGDRVPPGSPYPREEHPELYDFTWRTGRVLPEYQFVFIAEGCGEFETAESGLREVRPGTLMVLFPDVWHRYRPRRDTGWTEYWISLGGELLFQWQARGLLGPDRPLARLRRPAAVVQQYLRVIDFVTQRPEQDAPLLTARAMTIIAAALEQTQPLPALPRGPALTAERPLDPLVIETLRVIWNHSHRRLSVEMIAGQVGVTRRTLERHFQRQLGHTVLQELVGCRVQRAQRLLAETQVPVKHVAFAAGFSSVSSLCKVFRKETGFSPGDYRETILTAPAAKSNV